MLIYDIKGEGLHATQTLSTYKFKRAFFRHERRTAPKFGTHVRMETRLALTKTKLTNPTPEGFRGLLCLWHVGLWDVCVWDVCGWHDSSRW